jgi:hypothetical protein
MSGPYGDFGFEICIWGPLTEPSLSCQWTWLSWYGEVEVTALLTWEDVSPGTYEVRETDIGAGWAYVITPEFVEVLPEQTAYSTVANTRVP